MKILFFGFLLLSSTSETASALSLTRYGNPYFKHKDIDQKGTYFSSSNEASQKVLETAEWVCGNYVVDPISNACDEVVAGYSHTHELEFYKARCILTYTCNF